MTNSWSQYGESATHANNEPNDNALRNHLSLDRSTYMAAAWSFNAGSGIHGSVDVVDGVAYLADAGGIVDAINVETGVEKWSTHASGTAKIDTTPAVVNGLVIVGSVNQHLYALNASTGKVVWTTLLRGPIESSASAAGGHIYIGDDSGDVYELTASSGKVLWRSEATGAVKGSPTVDTSDGFVVVGDARGSVRAFALANGALRWTYATSGAITAPPIINSQRVYVGSHSGTEYALQEKTGTVQWKRATGAPIGGPATLLAGFGGIGNKLVVPSGDAVDLLDATSGALQDSIVQPGTVVGTAGAMDFAASVEANGSVGAARPLTGSRYSWTASLPTTLSSSPTVVNGEVFATGNDGTVQCWTVPGAPAV